MQTYSSGAVRLRIAGSAPPALDVAPRPDPAKDEARVAAVLAALDGGNLDDAGKLAEQGLKSGSEHPVLLCVLAMALQTGGRLKDSLPYLRRAVALQPADASIANALARCLLGLQRPEEALQALDATLALEPRHAETHANRGQALERLGRLAEAEQSYLKALELLPDQIVARAGMASLCNHFGAYDDARTHAQTVLDAAPGYAPAALTLAMVELAQGAPAAAEKRIRRLLAEPSLDPLLDNYLGDALDAQDRVDEAFEAWSRSGEALRAVHAGRFADDDILTAAEHAAEVFESAGSLGGQALAAAPDGMARHAFLLGFARSGTSLLGLTLAGHGEVEILDEQEPLIDAMREFGGPGGPDRLLRASEAELQHFRGAYWRRVKSAGALLRRPLLVDKQPMNSLNLPLIARLFPEARILLAQRDPRDVVLSCFRRRFLMNRYTYAMLSAEGAARLYAAAMRLAQRAGELAPLQIHRVSHEALVSGFETEVGAICRFLGLPPCETMGAFAERVRSSAVATPSASQLIRGLNSDGVGQWRRYARQLQPLAPILEPWVKRFGYESSLADEAARRGSARRAA